MTAAPPPLQIVIRPRCPRCRGVSHKRVATKPHGATRTVYGCCRRCGFNFAWIES